LEALENWLLQGDNIVPETTPGRPSRSTETYAFKPFTLCYVPLCEVNNFTSLYKWLVYSNLKRLLQLSVDSELREVLKTSLPLVLVELVSSLYSLTDTYFVSGLGAEALAGLGISMYVLMFLQSAIVLFTTPILIVVSQSLGAGRLDLARSFLAGILLVGGVYTTVLGFLSHLFSKPLVALISGIRGLTLEYSVEYLKLRCLGLIALYTTTALDMTIISTSKTHYSLIANATGLVLNAVLDPLLIYGYCGFPRLEVVGAALATVVSNTAVIPLQLVLLGRLGLTPSKLILLTLQPRRRLDWVYLWSQRDYCSRLVTTSTLGS
jgi:Na+-driven multidrug efflux pump